MDEKKSLFESLKPGSALALGIVGGALLLGTIGFVVLGIIMLKGNGSATAKTNNSEQVAQQQTGQQATVIKSDRPKVELFIMTYCPYGLQMQKAYLPAMQLLKDKADIDVKFVYYAMHGQQEIEENTRQYCIEKEQADKYISYLTCFTGKDDFQGCLKTAGINQAKLNSCTAAADKQFGIMAAFNDQSKWLSGQYPLYPVYSDLNQQYGVQGSPTLIINGAEAQADRTPEAVKQAICAAFNNAPEECNTTLSNTPASVSFGAAAGTDVTAAACGT